MNYKIQLLILFVFSSASHSKVTVIYNANGYTLNQYELTQFESLAFEDGRVLQIGSNSKIKELYADVKLVDAQGLTVLPGLHDSNTNIMQAIQQTKKVDLRGITSLKEVQEKIQDYIDKNPNNKWIEGFGWDNTLWENKKLPSKKDLDALNTNQHIWLTNTTGRIGWANSSAIKITRAFKYKRNPKMGKIEFDENQEHRGIYHDNALNLIQPHVTRMPIIDRYYTLVDILKDLSSLGITTLDDSGIDQKTANLYKSLAAKSKLSLRINAIISSADKDLDEFLEKGSFHYENQLLHIHAIKYFIDNSIESYGAAVIQPYKDNKKTSKGTIRQPLDFLDQEITKRAASGWQANLLANGDMASHIAFTVLSNKKSTTAELRHRIEEATLISSKDFNQGKLNGQIISIQPNFALAKIPLLNKRINKKSLKNTFAWQSLIKNGARLIAGSHYPQSTANPFYGIHALVTQQNRESKHTWKAKEKLTVEQALAAYTINPAFANHQENSLGSLERGKWADFIIIDQDIFKIKAQDIWKTKVLQTWLAGKKIYESDKTNASNPK